MVQVNPHDHWQDAALIEWHQIAPSEEHKQEVTAALEELKREV